MARIAVILALLFSLNVPTNAAPMFRDCTTDADCMFLWNQTELSL